MSIDKISQEKREEIEKIQAAIRFFKSCPDEPLAKKLEWVKLLNLRHAKLSLSQSKLSNYFRANEGTNFENTPSSAQISSTIEQYIKSKYECAWDFRTKTYRNSTVPLSNREYVRYLKGVWKGYSWNKSKYEEHNEGLPRGELEMAKCHVKVFKFEIQDNGAVLLETERALFEGTISSITDEKFYIDLSGKDCYRKLFFIGQIGSWSTEVLSELRGITLAYADSGISQPKCGSAVIFRTTEPYENIVATSLPTTKISPNVVDFLSTAEKIGNQIIIPPFGPHLLE